MKKIYDKIREYEHDGELWYLCGRYEALNILESKGLFDWSEYVDQLVEQGSFVVIRMIETVALSKSDSIVRLISELVQICSDQSLEKIFYMLQGSLVSKLDEDVLGVILKRIETIDSPWRNLPNYQAIIDNINLRLKGKQS